MARAPGAGTIAVVTPTGRLATGLGAFAAAAAVVALAFTAAGGASQAIPAAGPGMMSGPGGGMMGGPGFGAGGAGAAGTARPSAARLAALRDRIDAWLAEVGYSGFEVAEVMAFANNDYVAVRDPGGRPAFELLTDLAASWVMEEPPSMMWNTRYGMMRGLGGRAGPMMGGWMTGGGWHGWSSPGAGRVGGTARAVEVANRWLAGASPGERVAGDAGGGAMGAFPGYYTFDTVRAGKTAGMISVDDATGAVWYHAWHGRFLAERDF